MKRMCWKIVPMLAAVVAGGCSSTLGPPARQSVTEESPTGGFILYNGKLSEPSTNYQPRDPGDYSDVHHR